jgi:hypothetical protein
MSSESEPRLPAEFDPRIEMPRCWAFGSYGRCELAGGHQGNHQIVQEWTDEACLNPAVQVPVLALPAFDDPPGAAVMGDDRCFSCGCPEAAHLVVGEDGEAMCSRHQCREYVA